MNYYLWLVKPDVGIITNIATTHTQFLKTKEGVAAEKSKLIKVLSETGVAVLNVEDSLVKSFSKNTKAKICWYGEGSEIYAKNVKLNQDLSTSFTLYINKNKKYVHMNAFGKQFVNNAIASSAAAFSLGVNLENIVKGIQIFKLSPHRLNIFRTVSNGIIFDDSYNSNPKAANESLDTFNCLAGAKTKIAVIGDMLELGKFEESSHKELGKKISKMDFEYLICVGSATRFVLEEASKVIGENKCFLTTNWSEALGIIKPLLGHDTALFVKGSRSIYLDKLVHSLT
jgi:UDP-N-acetylmuramoyl-tripeptide--D-alanyl-D-alanine ligase